MLSDANAFPTEARFSVFPRSAHPGPQEAHTRSVQKEVRLGLTNWCEGARSLARAISIQICSGSAAKTATTCAAAAKLEALQRCASCLFFSLSLSCSCAFVRRQANWLEADEFRLMARQVESSRASRKYQCRPAWCSIARH